MFDCYYELEPDFKTVFHPEKGTKGMIQETFVTTGAFYRVQNENNAAGWTNYFLMQDNNFLRQANVDLEYKNEALNSKLAEKEIHTVCFRIQQSYDDFCKYGIPEFKERTVAGITEFVKICKEKCNDYDETLKKQIKDSFEVCYKILLNLYNNAKNDEIVNSTIKSVQRFFLEYKCSYCFDINQLSSLTRAETVCFVSP